MGNREIDILEMKHRMKMEELEFERETQLKILEKQFEIEMRFKNVGAMMPQQPPQPQFQQPQYIGHQAPVYAEQPQDVEPTSITKSASKYSKKK